MPRRPYNRATLQKLSTRFNSGSGPTSLAVTHDGDTTDLELTTVDEMPWLIRLQGEAMPDQIEARTERLIEVLEQALVNLREA